MTGMPPVLTLLQPERREALRRAFEALCAEGRDAEQALSILAMQQGIAPSFLRQMVGLDARPPDEEPDRA